MLETKSAPLLMATQTTTIRAIESSLSNTAVPLAPGGDGYFVVFLVLDSANLTDSLLNHFVSLLLPDKYSLNTSGALRADLRISFPPGQ